MKMRLLKFVFAVLFLLPVCVNAIPITVQISGSITSASGSALPSTIHAGSTFMGTYTYDSSTLDSDTLSYRGTYRHNSPYGINLFLGGLEFKTVLNHIGQFEVLITNVTSANWDHYRIISNENVSVNGSVIDSISWTLGGPSSTISLIDLPISNPATIVELTDWDSNVLEISGQNLSIQGTVISAIIPEPLTGVLMIMGMFCLRRRR